MCVASFYDVIKSGLLLSGFYTAKSLVVNDKTGIVMAVCARRAGGKRAAIRTLAVKQLINMLVIKYEHVSYDQSKT